MVLQNFMKLLVVVLASISFVFYGCGTSSQKQSTVENNGTTTVPPLVEVDFQATSALHNSGAYVTSQCYTKTVDENNNVHNPCFSCHINSTEPNYIDDAELQESYDMREYTKKNLFTNLFKDRTDYVESMKDEDILKYVRENNYKDSSGNLHLRKKLQSLPAQWDNNDDGIWNGYMPDCYFNFDAEGFDKDNSGDYSGWRAFAYYPFLGTFWPTNGSFDDVLIRLPKVFQEDVNSSFDLEVYKLNLAIVEAMIKEKDIQIESVDEKKYGVDLNQNGVLDIANHIKYIWNPPSYDSQTNKITNFSMSYVGVAKALLESNEYLIAPGLYPQGTEFLHSVRYIDVVDDSVVMAPRMKELRYAKKENWNNYSQMHNAAISEIMEKDLFPDRLRTVLGDTENGLKTGLGWVYQGFIEDENGALRPQNYEETLYCIGCHSGIGAIADSTFVFQRKLDFSAKQKGWYHWSQDKGGFTNMKEPLTKKGLYEYSRYLEKNGAGDEFRDNKEIIRNYFKEGVLQAEKIEELHSDISKLLIPSPLRALRLNKAYKVIVDEQSFIFGRDAHVEPVENVHKEVIPQSSTGNKIVYN